MVLDTKIALVKEHFGIAELEDWKNVDPFQILEIDGVGPVTLDHIRLYLSAHDITLRDDNTPEYWAQKLAEARVCHTMGAVDRKAVNPFTVIVDGREKAPYFFRGLTADANQKNRPLIVQCEYGHLLTGDYAIRGMETQCCVERKSLEDLYSTLGQHRERFEEEFVRMSTMPFAAVVVESDWHTILTNPPERSKLNPKTVYRTVLSWEQRYPMVHWHFMGDRRLAEITTFRVLERFWRQRKETAVCSGADEQGMF